MLPTLELCLDHHKAHMQTVEGKTVNSGLRLYACDQYRLLITVGGVDGDFSQTIIYVNLHISCFFVIITARCTLVQARYCHRMSSVCLSV